MPMNLKILLPYQVFAEISDVKRIVVETPKGSYGLLPHRLDCTTILSPGILTYETDKEEVFLAIDEGIMVKTGYDVLISTRNAIGGEALGQLHKSVEEVFLNIDEQEKKVRSVIAKLETNFIRRFEEFRRT